MTCSPASISVPSSRSTTGTSAEATIALAHVDDPSAFGVVPTYRDGEVKAFVEKPPVGSAPTDWINAGTYVLEPSVLERIPAGLTVSIERETFPRMLQERHRLYAMASDDYWIDIGTPDQYLNAHADVLAGRMGPEPTADAQRLAPGVWIQGDRTGEGMLEAPVLLGDGCTSPRGDRARARCSAPGFASPAAPASPTASCSTGRSSSPTRP